MFVFIFSYKTRFLTFFYSWGQRFLYLWSTPPQWRGLTVLFNSGLSCACCWFRCQFYELYNEQTMRRFNLRDNH